MRAFKVVRNLTIVAAVCAIVFLIVSLFFEKASDYTVAEHTARVTELAKKRYLKEDSEYTDLEVFPLYDENNELKYFLIEFEPYGFVYIKIRNEAFAYDYVGLYLRDFYEGRSWVRYAIEIGSTAIYTDNQGFNYEIENAVLLEVDASSKPILHNISYFKAANIKNEKLYLLSYQRSLIPAVKRNGKYFNLISLEYIDYGQIIKQQQRTPTFHCYFLPKSEFRL